MDELLAGVRNAKANGKKLLIFVHGGLNTQTGSVKRVKKLTPRILGCRLLSDFHQLALVLGVQLFQSFVPRTAG